MSEKKKAIVVGASSGIGRELARQLTSNGYRVGIIARREKLLLELACENPDSYIVKAFDLMQTESIEYKLNELKDELGGLDVIAISAGIIKYNVDLNFEPERQTILVNVLAFTQACDWAFNLFREQNSGQILALTSVAGYRGWRNNPAYNASKAYEINYMEGLRNLAFYQKKAITITTVILGYVDTAMMGKTLVFWVASAEEAAKRIYRAIRKKQKRIFVYRRWRYASFIYKHLPNFILKAV